MTEDSVENQVETLKKPKDTRQRNYCCEVYPDSAPKNWLSLLNDLHIPALVSPFHDKDVNPFGEPKKPHWHVLMCFEGKKSFDQFKSYVDSFGGVCPPEKEASVNSIRGYARYLCHLDNPEKYQYPVSEIKCFGGADYETYVTLASDISKELKLMQKFIRHNAVCSFSVFLDICADNFPDWHFLITTRCTSIVKEYIKSIEYDNRKEQLKQKAEREFEKEFGGLNES